MRRPEAADRPVRRSLSESEPSLVLGIIHAVCRDFLRCLIDTDRLGRANANRRYSGCRGQVFGQDLESAQGGGWGGAARCRSRSSCRWSFPTTFCALGARGVPRPMVRFRATGCWAEPCPGYEVPTRLSGALPDTDPPLDGSPCRSLIPDRVSVAEMRKTCPVDTFRRSPRFSRANASLLSVKCSAR